MASVQPPAPVPPSSAPAPATPVEGAPVPADVVKLPPSLENVDRALTLRGEVQQVNPDGTVRIATPRGPIDVKLPDGQQVARGQNVEVQVSAGNPPRDVAVTLPQTQTPRPLPIPPTPLPPAPSTQTQTTPTPIAPSAQPQTSGPTTSLPTPSQSAPVQSTPPPTAPPIQSPLNQTPIPDPLSQTLPNTAPQISPQSLLNFLKTSLQTLLKTPENTPTQNVDMLVGVQQRPLQIGQLVRLLPVHMATQTAIHAAPAGTAASQTQLNPLASSTGQALPAHLTPTSQTHVVALVPSSANQLQGIPIQNAMQNVLGNAVNLGIPQTSSVDPIARLLLPFFAGNQAAVAMAPQSPGQTAPAILTQLTLANFIQPHSDASTPHIPVLAHPGTTQTIPAQQPIDVRIAGMLPMAAQNAPAPATASLLHGSPAMPTIFAQVTGQTAQGLPIVELPTFTIGNDGLPKMAAPSTMILQFPARGLSPATILKLDVLQTSPALQSSTPFATADAITWEALDEVIRNIAHQPIQQAAAQMQAVQAAIPKPGSIAFSAPVLMFVAALRGGDITAWMGEKGVEVIRGARRTDALARVSGDFTATARRLDDPAPSSEWRSITLPMIYGQDLSRVQLHYRSFDRDDASSDEGKKTGTRFIMDLSLTRMGAMQIDGFSIERKLDVVLRSERPLSAGMREMMRQRYINAMSGIGFAGELNFRADPTHKEWITI